MYKHLNVPWAAWYGDKEIQLEFPETGTRTVNNMEDTTELSQGEIKNAFINPIGSPTVQEIAKGKSNAVIAVEDISRPTQLETVLDILLNQLNEAGITNDNVTLIYALGAYRPMREK